MRGVALCLPAALRDQPSHTHQCLQWQTRCAGASSRCSSLQACSPQRVVPIRQHQIVHGHRRRQCARANKKNTTQAHSMYSMAQAIHHSSVVCVDCIDPPGQWMCVLSAARAGVSTALIRRLSPIAAKHLRSPPSSAQSPRHYGSDTDCQFLGCVLLSPSLNP
jgi:hypothetical protein